MSVFVFVEHAQDVLCPGAPFQWNAVYGKNEVCFTQGHDKLEFYNTQTGEADRKLPSKVLCKECHSPLANEGNVRPPMQYYTDNTSWCMCCPMSHQSTVLACHPRLAPQRLTTCALGCRT